MKKKFVIFASVILCGLFFVAFFTTFDFSIFNTDQNRTYLASFEEKVIITGHAETNDHISVFLRSDYDMNVTLTNGSDLCGCSSALLFYGNVREAYISYTAPSSFSYSVKVSNCGEIYNTIIWI